MTIAISAVSQGVAGEATVWFGTGGEAKGVYRTVLDLETGGLTEATLAAEISGAGFLVINQQGTRLYSLGQVATGSNVAAYEIGADRQTLTLLNSADTEGGKPTHISLSRDENTLLLAHYGGGSVATLALDDDGRIGHLVSRVNHSGASIDPTRQDRPHPHWIGATPDNRFVLVPDLGTDEIVIYRFDPATHVIRPHGAGVVPPGSGPRHLAFHPGGKWLYVVNEIGLTVSSFHYDGEQGTLIRFQTEGALPAADRKPVELSGSEIRMHPNGKYLYAGIRGQDVVVMFRIDQISGELTRIEAEPIRGSWPRNFGIDPTGRWLVAAGAESNTAAVFAIQPESGRMIFSRNQINVPDPICVAFLLR